ncbi:MAG: hypothetical protein AB7O73_05805 [Bacteroidia bacterium]
MFQKRIYKLLIIILLPGLPLFSQTNKLKALLIVGPQEDMTNLAVKEMDKIADLLKMKNITVYTFYDEKAEWKKIVSKAKECNILIYSGHGSKMGENGGAGGICVDKMISTNQLLSELKLKENSLVVFKSVCNGAGSSAGDDKDIGIEEAKKRVSNYAYPFFKIGAKGYYANNMGNGAIDFLKDFLEGQNLKNAYINTTKYWSKIEFESQFPNHQNKSFSIASSPGGGMSTRISYKNGKKTVTKIKSPKNYNIAYAGNSSFTISDMK